MDLSELSFRGGASGPSMAFNAYFDNSDYRYISTETAFKIEQDQTNNVLEFEYAVAGTAGNIVSWTNGITMNTSGNVGINAGVLQVSGTTFVAYNRYGTGTTNHGLTGTSDLLVSDDLEINGVLYEFLSREV